MNIPFNRPPRTGSEDQHVINAMQALHMCGDGFYGKKCQRWFEESLPATKCLMTPSCTAALELSALLIDIKPGDEVIMPSYTFVSTANAFVLRGAKIAFVDIRPDTMNINERLIEAAITDKTRAIVPVHYAGVSCDMSVIMDIAVRYNLYVIEDAAQAMMSRYKDQALGTIGHLGAFSFHETKNYTSGGEGGLLVINDENLKERAEIIREKGTNRSQFFRGMVDKYQWVDIGSSYLPSELQAAYLWGQIEQVNEINDNRRKLWSRYYDALLPLENSGKLSLPIVPVDCTHNAHMFYLKTANIEERTALINFLKNKGIIASFHYIPLHTAPAGHKFGFFIGQDNNTTNESERLVRLPMWYGLNKQQQVAIVSSVKEFYS